MSTKRNIIAIMTMAVLMSYPVLAGDGQDHGDAKMKMQMTCPVTGGKINKKLYVDKDGKRIYVCCPGCIGKVKADPEKYIKKLEAKGEHVATLQTTCPVMGGKINKDLFVDYKGKRIYVCCKGCIDPIKKNPEKYIKKLKEKGEVPANVPMKNMMNEGSHHEGSHH